MRGCEGKTLLGSAAVAMFTARRYSEAKARAAPRELPVYERLGDLDGIAAAQWHIAQIALARGQIEEAVPRLAEAWELLDKLGGAEGLAVVGRVFGQVLLARDMREQAGYSTAAPKHTGSSGVTPRRNRSRV